MITAAAAYTPGPLLNLLNFEWNANNLPPPHAHTHIQTTGPLPQSYVWRFITALDEVTTSQSRVSFDFYCPLAGTEHYFTPERFVTVNPRTILHRDIISATVRHRKSITLTPAPTKTLWRVTKAMTADYAQEKSRVFIKLHNCKICNLLYTQINFGLSFEVDSYLSVFRLYWRLPAASISCY